MIKKFETVESSSTAQDIAIKMNKQQVSSILVIDDKDGAPIGIVTERDLSRKVCAGDKSGKDVLANQIMSSPLITVESDSSLSGAADLMLKNKVRHLLVMETEYNQDSNKKEIQNGKGIIKPIGIVTPMDFIRYKALGTTDYDKYDNDEDKDVEKILEYYKNDFDFFGNIG